MKKFLSLIIVAIMLMTMTVPAVSAAAVSSAAAPTATSTGTPTLYMTNSSAKAGQTLEMNVCIRDNPGIFAINIKLDFPKDVLELVDATDGLMKVTGKNTSEASGDYGTILAESETTGVDVTGNGALFTVKFKIKDGATAQECTVGLNVISANNTALAYVTPATESGTASVTDRMVVSTVSGTATANYPPVYGNKAAKPTITVTEGAPAYFDIDYSNGYWYRRNADSTNTRLETDDTFTAGTYCFRCQIRIDGSSGTTYVLSKDGMTVSVNGTNWEVSSATIDDRFSYAWVRSPDFVVTAPVGEPLSFAESSFFNIGNSTARVAITPKNISTGATGGTSPYTFSKVSGPDWLNVSATGMISGTPTAAGTNEPLVVRVTDSVSATVEFSLSVGDTSMNPADRTVVSTVSGTATANYPPVYGNKAAKPTITVTEGAPAYFDIDYSNGYWYRKNADSTVTKLETGDTFTEGTYYFRCQIRIDGTSGTTHVLSKDGMTVSVNGVNWEVSSATIDDRFSYAWVSSPDFVVTAPGETNPAKPTINVTGTYTYTGSDITATVTGYDSATMNITGNVGKNAGSYTVSVTSKTGQWADGTTDAVEVEWTIAKAAQEKPTGLGSDAPSATDASDGKITGVTSAMQYRRVGTTEWVDVTGTTITGLAAGAYEIRLKETENFKAGEAELVSVPMHAHTFGTEWKHDNTNHWHECACGEKSDSAAHDFGEWTVVTPATETEKGSRKRTCATCSYEETEEIPATGHIHAFGTEWKHDSTNHWHECACGEKSDSAAHDFGEWTVVTPATETEKGSRKRTCATCSYEETEEIPATGHTHAFGTEWKHDSTNHWHECACGEKSDSAAHSGGTATCKEKATCSVCGVKYGELAAHNFTKQDTDAKYLKSAATCTAKAVYFHSCTVCGEKGTTTFEYGEKSAHSFGDWKTTKTATETEKGLKERVCSVCSYKETEELPLLAHTHKLTAVSGKDASCTEDGVTAHYVCDGCGKIFEDKDGRKEITDKSRLVIPAAHRFGEWQEEIPATTEKEGVKAHKDCTVCGKHFDRDGAEMTDLTIAKLPGEDNPNTPEDPTDPPAGEDGLSGGAIAGIVIAAVVIVGIGGFAIVWFVIKKKTFAELVAAIKAPFKKN